MKMYDFKMLIGMIYHQRKYFDPSKNSLSMKELKNKTTKGIFYKINLEYEKLPVS